MVAYSSRQPRIGIYSMSKQNRELLFSVTKKDFVRQTFRCVCDIIGE